LRIIKDGGIDLLQDEQIEDLDLKGLHLIQKKNGFRFGLDSVLLSHFTNVKKNAEVLDIGTGSGIIPILLSAKTHAKRIVGVEIQQIVADVAKRNVILNKLDSKVEIICHDIKNYDSIFKKNQFDVVTSNPPYMPIGKGIANPNDTKAISRHEITLDLESLIDVSASLLKQYGIFSIVHKPERLADIVCLMRMKKLEPKFLRFVYPRYGKKPSLILVQGVKNGNPYFKVNEPLYVFDINGQYTDDINVIYGKR
jgi:tRNA1Val (adenine37-N6)-methyltransferase